MSTERSQEHLRFHPKKQKRFHQISSERRSPSPFPQTDQDGPLDFSKKSTLSDTSTTCKTEETGHNSSQFSYPHQNGHYEHYSGKCHLQGPENHVNGLTPGSSVSNGGHLRTRSPLKNHESTSNRDEPQFDDTPPEAKPVHHVSSHTNEAYTDHSLTEEKLRILENSNWRSSSLSDTRNTIENSIISPTLPITTKTASFIPGPIISVPPLLGGVPVLETMSPYLNGHFSQQSPILLTNGERQSLRHIRPFKAFSDELLLGNYSAPSSSNSFSSTVSPPNYYNHSKNRSASVSSNIDIKKESPETENRGNTMSVRSTNMNTDLDMKSDAHGSGDSDSSFSNSYSNCQQPDTSSGCHNRRKSRTMPEELKDAAYWERRRKNNEAAKRSRDARRQKEDAITLRAKQLHEENNQLRFYLTTMQKHIAFQETQNRALLEERHTKDALIRQLQDELSKKRICSSCTS